jgi:hypothetical protein
MVRELVVVESEKSPDAAALTLRVIVTLWLSLPTAPAITMGGVVPAGADELVQTVNVEEPTPLIEAGLKLADIVAGNPLKLNPTLLLNPLARADVDTV